MPEIYKSLLAAAILCLQSLPSWAQTASDLEVYEDDSGVLAFLSGPIEMHHVDQLREAIRDNPDVRPFYLVLDSEGGDVKAGIALGRMMRDLGIFGSVPEDAECLSSCAIALFGAEERILLGTIGLHRPYFWVGTGNAQPSGADIQNMYDEVKAYLAEMYVPQSVFEEMMRIEPEDMRFFRRSGSTHEIDSIMPRNDPVYAERRTNLQAARYGMDSVTYRSAMADVNARCHRSGGDPDMNALAFAICQTSVLFGIDESEAANRMQEASRTCAISEEAMQVAIIEYFVNLEDYFNGRRNEGWDTNRFFFFATHKSQLEKDECFREIMSR